MSANNGDMELDAMMNVVADVESEFDAVEPIERWDPPAGLYEVIFEDVNAGEGREGRKYIRVQFQIVSGEYEGRSFAMFLSLGSKNMPFTKAALQRLAGAPNVTSLRELLALLLEQRAKRYAHINVTQRGNYRNYAIESSFAAEDTEDKEEQTDG